MRLSSSEAKEIITGKLPGCNRVTIRAAWQHLVDTGEIWQMAPKFTKYACVMLDAGIIERNAA